MTYQIKQLATLAGVSVRTLRYYDQLGLLKPAYVGRNGYRYYETPQVDRLQRICLYRQLRLPLATINRLLDQPADQVVDTLQQQLADLVAERQRLDQLLTLVRTTIKNQQEGSTMTDEAKFQAFKDAQLATNAQTYGDELKAHYDAATIQAANAKYAQLSAADYQRMQVVEAQLIDQLKAVLASGDLTGTAAQRVYPLHREWLTFTWPKYTAAMHRGLAQMYLADPRFTRYYDQRAGQGATGVLVKLIERDARD